MFGEYEIKSKRNSSVEVVALVALFLVALGMAIYAFWGLK